MEMVCQVRVLYMALSHKGIHFENYYYYFTFLDSHGLFRQWQVYQWLKVKANSIGNCDHSVNFA